MDAKEHIRSHQLWVACSAGIHREVSAHYSDWVLQYVQIFTGRLTEDLMAEREGFEPPIALRLCLISSQVHSTGLCHLSDIFSLPLK